MEKAVQYIITNIVKWAPSGVGIGVTIHSVVEQEWLQAVLMTFVTACSSIWVKFSGKFIEEAGKEAETRGGGLARWIFVVSDHIADSFQQKIAKFWRQLISDFEDKYYERLIYICRNYETQGLDKEQVLELQYVFVPLKISQKSLTQISPDLIRELPQKLSTQRDIGKLLAMIGDGSVLRRFAILGAPGAGKTTLLRYLTLVYASRQQKRLLDAKAPKFIPVLIYLRSVREEIISNPILKLDELINIWVKRLQSIEPLAPPPDWFADRLRRNDCLILLDGLDEIADEHERRLISQWVDQQMYEYSKTTFILTSRPLGYKNAKLEQPVTVLEVEPFTMKQVQQFVHNWYLETEIRSQGHKDDLGVREEAKQEADDLIERIRGNAPLSAMAANPLLLTMIATVHRRGSALPGKRVELYKEICQVLLEKRQLAKRIPDVLTSSQKQSVLQGLALYLMQQEIRSFTFSEVASVVGSRLQMVLPNALEPSTFLKQIREVSGLLVAREEEVYEFVHLSFQEYLASVEIRKSNQEWILVDALLDSEQLSWWAETTRLYAAQGDSSGIIRAAMQASKTDVSTVDILALAFDCLDEGERVDPKVRKELEKLLEQGLEDR